MSGTRRILITTALIAALAMTAMAPAASSAPGDGYAYPRDVKRAFISGCVEGGGERAQCRCVMRKIERRYKLRQFLRIARRAERTGRFPTAINRFIKSCG